MTFDCLSRSSNPGRRGPSGRRRRSAVSFQRIVPYPLADGEHMTHHRSRVFTGVFAIVSAGAVVFLEGSGAPPRTREGRPDLQGVWSYATLTPLERPDEFAGKAFFTDAEAIAFKRRTLDVQNRDRRDGDGPSGRGPDGRTDLDRAYNQ